MKPKLDDKYLKICIYVLITAIAIYLAFMLINSIPAIYKVAISSIAFILGMLKPLIFGLIIAYILFAPTKGIASFLNNRKHIKIKNKKMQKLIGILVSYIILIGVITLLLWGIYFMIGGQLSKNTTLSNIVEDIAYYFEKNAFSQEALKDQITALNIPFIENLDEYISDIIVWIQKFITNIMNTLLDSLVNIGSNLFTIFLALVLSIYLLYDSDYFMRLWKRFFFMIFRNSKLGSGINKSLSIINTTFSGYIKGQLIEALIVAVLTTVALMIVGIDYALLIGIISGIFNLIPYIGPLVGTILACIIGLLGGDGVGTAIFAVIAMIIVQQVDSNIIAPRVVGNSVGLHPFFIMIAVIIGASWGGLIGMLIAVPIAASSKKLISLWYKHNFEESYLESERAKKDEKKSEE